MFNPSKEEVRRFFCETWRKSEAGEVLTPLEAIARDWIVRHPDYAEALADIDAALAADYGVDTGRSNPFLHLAMHVSIDEQLAIDQPTGIRAAFNALAARRGNAHDAHHEIMECLGEMLWTAQRNGTPPDGDAYVACVNRRAQG